jgi:hypothetical protein
MFAIIYLKYLFLIGTIVPDKYYILKDFMQEKEIKELTRVIKDFFGLTVDILFDAVYECTKDEELAKK